MPTLEQYRNMLPVNKLRLDDELEIQAQVQMDISSECARLNTKALEAENYLKSIEAELFIRLKDKAEKMTADEVKARIRVHEDRVRAWEHYQTIRETHEHWTGLLSAWITKGYKLADIGGLYASDYFAMTTIKRPDGARTRELNPIEEESRSAIRRATERADSDSAPRRRTAL
jgi:hypothetical protein